MGKASTVLTVVLLGILPQLSTSLRAQKAEPPPLAAFDQVRAQFADPPAEFRTMPFWVWNTQVTRSEIDRQLEDYRKMRFGGLFLHPRYGLITEYLSDEWFSLVQYAVNKGKALGLEIWLYDENSFPSGFAGGHVPAQMPESYNQGQGLQMTRQATLSRDELAASYLVLQSDSREGFIPVDPGSRGPFPTADYYLFRKCQYEKGKWFAGFSYVDLIQPGVTQKFIQVTMDGYEKSIGDAFGTTVPGIFTDEPHLHPPNGKNMLRWTPSLFRDFQKRWGYDLRFRLPSLLEEVGDWRKVRHNYYKLLLELFIERWSKPWHAYTESHHLQWTGHYWEHEWPRPVQGPDNMAMYAWHQLPAIDMLFNTFNFGVDAQFGNVRSVKELASVANQFGRRRKLSETYGAAGWELRFEDMKRLGDWEYALGVNFMNQHLSYMSLTGDRKHDFPQSFSEHEPWWPLYRAQADYFGRLSLALTTGEQINSTLVLEPTSTAWMYFSPSTPNFRFGPVGDDFQAFVVALERRQFEYDLGSEEILEQVGSVQKGRLQVGKRAYDRLVLPPGLGNLNSKTADLMELFLKSGGQIIAFVDPPGWIDGTANPRLRKLAQQFPKQWRRLDSAPQLTAADCSPSAVTFDNLDQVDGLLFHQRRVLDDGQLLFLVNSSLEETAKGAARISGKSLLRLDPSTGAIAPYPATAQGTQVEFRYELPPAGSLLLFAGKQASAAEPERPPIEWQLLASEGPIRTHRLDPNVLVLDYCDLELAGRPQQRLYFYTAANQIWRQHGFDDNPWVSSSQYKTEILDRADSFAPDSGFTATFPFHLEPGTPTKGLRAVIERPELWQVTLNGHPLAPLPGAWWLDRDFGVFPIESFVQEGENRISVAAHPMCIHCELEPIYLLGDFSLNPADQGWVAAPARPLVLGDWRVQGLPFYAHRVAYETTFQLPPNVGTVQLRLGKWLGTVAEVRVNGQAAGIIQAQPYELDLSSWTVPGSNQVEVIVYGSLKNLLGPHHNVRQVGIVTPWSFKSAPEVQPPGTEYDGVPYGLKAPFEIRMEEP